MVWGDFIKANSFASASLISNSWSGIWNRRGSNRYIVPVYGNCCCVEPIEIVDNSSRAADDTSIHSLPSLSVNLEVQNLSWSVRERILLHVSVRDDESFFFLWHTIRNPVYHYQISVQLGNMSPHHYHSHCDYYHQNRTNELRQHVQWRTQQYDHHWHWYQLKEFWLNHQFI